MKDCIFCKIIKKQIPANIIYEDKETLAFLDISPATKQGGHTLVIPKQHYETIEDIPEDLLNKTVKTVKKLSIALLKQAQGVNIIQNNKKASGQLVPHIHFHIIPRYKDDGVNIGTWKQHKYQKNQIEKVQNNIKNLLK